MSNRAEAVGDQAAWLVSREVLRLGTVDGPDAERFGSVLGIAVQDSLLFVVDRLAKNVQVFDTTGRHIRTLGRGGQGPGEFEAPVGAVTDGLGRLWVRDARGRYTVFDVDGKVLDVHHSRFTVRVAPWAGRVLSSSVLLDWAAVRGHDLQAARPDQTVLIPIRMDLHRGTLDTLASLEYINDMAFGPYPRPYGNVIHLAVDDSAFVWFGESRTYRVYKRLLEGDTLLDFSLETTPPRVSPAERDSLMRPGNWIPGRRLSAEHIPNRKDSFLAIVPADFGFVLVFPRVSEYQDGAVVDIFTREGRFDSRVLLPTPLSLVTQPVVRWPYLYGMTEDEFGVDYVVRVSLQGR